MLRSLTVWFWKQQPSPLSQPRSPLSLEVLEDRLVPAQLIVTSPLDTGFQSAGTLRAAINQANGDAAAGQSDTILFAPSLAGKTITLQQGVLDLNGAGAGTILIDGSGLSSSLSIRGNHTSPVFQIEDGTHAIFNKLRIQGGTAGTFGVGGGIANFGTLTVTNTTFSGNSSAYGGAIWNGGTLFVSNSTFSNNSAANGGGIGNSSTMTVSNCTFSGNSAFWGGGIYNEGTLTVNTSTFSGNSAFWGGGIYNFYSGSNNVNGTLVPYGVLTMNRSTFSGNSASYGGGLFSNGTVTADSSTFSGNSARIAGGGIGSAGQSLTLVNTTVTGNRAPTSPDINGLVSGNNNRIGNGAGLFGLINGVDGNRIGLAPSGFAFSPFRH